MQFLVHVCGMLIVWVARSLKATAATRWQPAQGLVEYGLVLVLIAIFAVGAMTVTGQRISSTFHEADCGLRNAQMGSPDC